MRIASFDTEEQVLVVAEIGNNHEGDVDLAARMVELAADAGADAVKFQAFRTAHYVSPADRERFERLRSFELTLDQLRGLADAARSRGLLVIATPFDSRTATDLADLVDALKIASGDNTFGPLLDAAAETGRPLIVSTGLADASEIAETRQRIDDIWRRLGLWGQLGLLHCVASYPVPPGQANLAAIGTLWARFGETIGYSDHTEGIEAAVLSVAAGARIVEKHFTIANDHSDFRDHRLSADPTAFAEMVRRIRDAERLRGGGDLDPRPCEHDAIPMLRRSIAAAADLPAGTKLSREHVTWVRPGHGLAPGDEHRLLGRTLAHAVAAGTLLTPDALASHTVLPSVPWSPGP